MMRKTAWVATCWALLLSGCSDSDSKGSGAGTSGSSVKAATSGASGKPVVEMETSMGTVVLELDPEHAPITVENFLKYVDDGFYAGTIFHRVMPNFMIQGGGFEPGMGQKSTRSPIKNEATNGLKNVRGSIAMARTGDPHSATAQFFINVVDNAGLDHPGPGPSGWGYCVFGKVVSGMDVVDKIKSVSTTRKGPHENVPVEDVIIKSMKRKK